MMRLAQAGAVAIRRESTGYHQYWTTSGMVAVADEIRISPEETYARRIIPPDALAEKGFR